MVFLTLPAFPSHDSVGDANSSAGAIQGRLQIYRGTTALGNEFVYESNGTDENQSFGFSVIDTNPGIGSVTYNLKTNFVNRDTNYGEVAGPVIYAFELANVKGDSGISGYSGATFHHSSTIKLLQEENLIAWAKAIGWEI